MARPTILTAELVAAASEYLNTDKENKRVLTIEGLALTLGISRETIYDWENHEPKDDETFNELSVQFSDIVSRVRLQQSEKLIQNGLDGTYNPMITKLLLSKHGYVERSDVTSGNKPINPALVEFVGDDATDENTD